jgi:hypothetical protein
LLYAYRYHDDICSWVNDDCADYHNGYADNYNNGCADHDISGNNHLQSDDWRGHLYCLL